MAIDAGPPDESYDNNVVWFIDSLPTYMANDEQSGNWKLYTPIGNRVSELEEDIEAVDRAASVQEADTIDQLDALAKMVNLHHEEGETKEHYRSRIFAKYQLNTSEGTLSDIMHSVATILDVDIERIGYEDYTEHGVAGITMPGSAVDNLNLSAGEIDSILDDLAPASHRIEGQKRGTYTYLSPSSYSGGNPYDPSALNSTANKGHDGLDSSGNPKNNGGTYAGIIG